MHNSIPVMATAALFATGLAPLTSEAAGENKLEVFSWWTSGGEAAALKGLYSMVPERSVLRADDADAEILRWFGL